MISKSRNRLLALAAGALFLLGLFLVVPPLFRSEPAPASPAVLENIAERNEKAALEAAAIQRQQSEASAIATDQAIAKAEDVGKARANQAIRDADANEAGRQAEPRE